MHFQSTQHLNPEEVKTATLRALRIARTLLDSMDKNHDLPLVMHAHACLVVGCSDQDDCYEKMEQACRLFHIAMEEKLLPPQQGEEMLNVCHSVMQVIRREHESEDESDEDGDDDYDSEETIEGEDDGGVDEYVLLEV